MARSSSRSRRTARTPITTLKLPAPINLLPDYGHIGPAVRRIMLPIFAGMVGAPRPPHPHPPTLARPYAHLDCCACGQARRAVAVVAAIAVVASSYPVVFLGKSFVSPNFGVVLLYEAFPRLPGNRDGQIRDVKGADIGAIMWAHISALGSSRAAP